MNSEQYTFNNVSICFTENKALTISMVIKSYVSYSKGLKHLKFLNIIPNVIYDRNCLKINKLIEEHCIKCNLNLFEEARFINVMHPSSIFEVALNLSSEPVFEPNNRCNQLLHDYYPGLKPLPKLLKRLVEEYDFNALLEKLKPFINILFERYKESIFFAVNTMQNFFDFDLSVDVYLLPSYTNNGNALKYQIDKSYPISFDFIPIYKKFAFDMIPIHETIHIFIGKFLNDVSKEFMDQIYDNLLLESKVRKSWSGKKDIYIDEIITRLFTAYCLDLYNNNSYGLSCIKKDERKKGYVGLSDLYTHFKEIILKYEHTLYPNKELFLKDLVSIL